MGRRFSNDVLEVILLDTILDYKIENSDSKSTLSLRGFCLSAYFNFILKHAWFILQYKIKGFPGGTSVKELTYQCRRCKRQDFNPWVRKILWRRVGNSLQYSRLENPVVRGVQRDTAHGATRRQDWRVLTRTHIPCFFHDGSGNILNILNIVPCAIQLEFVAYPSYIWKLAFRRMEN